MRHEYPDQKKKPYQTPQLRVYGTLRELTKLNTSGKGMQDNQIFSMLKT